MIPFLDLVLTASFAASQSSFNWERFEDESARAEYLRLMQHLEVNTAQLVKDYQIFERAVPMNLHQDLVKTLEQKTGQTLEQVQEQLEDDLFRNLVMLEMYYRFLQVEALTASRSDPLPGEYDGFGL